jgi:hypothetical protein
MPQILDGWRRSAIGQLGRCPFCMRKAFIAMVAAWGLTALLVNLAAPPGALATFGFAAVVLTLLWVSHLVAFASRISARPTMGDVRGLTSRRAALPLFVKVLAAAALASAAPRIAMACTSMGDVCNSKSECCSESDSCSWVTGCPVGKKCCN